LNRFKATILVVLTIFFTSFFTAMVPDQKKALEPLQYIPTDKTTRTLYNVNNLAGWILWDGESGYDPILSLAGIYYPRGTSNVVFEDGLLWEGIVRDGDPETPAIRVGGQRYTSGTAPGRIISPGVAQDPFDPEVRIYRIRQDWQSVSDVVLKLDVAELNDIDTSRVTQDQIDKVRIQYGLDWEQWPVEYGAPFYDGNHNGLYEPHLGEEPGLQNADQVIWFVCNDLDSQRTGSIFGSYPLRLELQATLWEYQSAGPLDQAVFRRYRLINKSGYHIDSMFVGQWSDTNVGDSGDDLLGCDSITETGYAYNGYSYDVDFKKYNLPPPAVGYTLLQGPILPSPGSTAIFDFKELRDYKNLRLQSCTPEIYWISDIPDLLKSFYYWLQGFRNIIYYEKSPYTYLSGPEKGKPTKFPLSGNPISRTGDVDGTGDNRVPGYRSFLMATGPFDMQPGDTQEVVIALVGGIDPEGDNLSSLVKLRENIRTIRGLYGTTIRFPRHTNAHVDHPNDSQSRLQVSLDLNTFEGVSASELSFTPAMGYESPFSLTLYDDGQHGDSLSRDSIWGNAVTVQNRKYPMDGNLIVHSSAGLDTFQATYSHLQLRPSPQMEDFQVSWENGRQDGKINYGEEVHLAFKLKNQDTLNGIDFLRVSVEQNGTQSNSYISAQSISGGEVVENPDLYALLKAPYSGDSLSFRLGLSFDGFYQVQDFRYPIIPWVPDTLWQKRLLVEILSGFSSNMEAYVADPARLTGHEYVIRFVETPDTSGDTLGWQLRDRSTGEIKLREGTFPAGEHPAYPVIDGIEYRVRSVPPGFASFQVVANAAGPVNPPEMGCFAFYNNGFPFLINARYPDGTDRPNWGVQQSINVGVWGIHTAMTVENDGSFAYFKERVLSDDDITRFIPYDYEMRFTQRGGLGKWAFEMGGTYPVPFELWNIGINTPDDASDDFRMIPLVQNDIGNETEGDTIYNINAHDHIVSGGDDDPYTDLVYWYEPTDKTSGESGYEHFVNNHDEVGDEVMARTVLVNWNGGSVADPDFPENLDAVMLETGTIFRIVSSKPNRAGDSLLIRAPSAQPDKLYDWPHSYRLSQNFPNPFNSETVILFELPQASRVRLEVYNILGQRVLTLLNDVPLERGYHRIHWDGRNGDGIMVSSGVYIYRFRVGAYTKVQKMILVR
jgi:hypothetical protein